MSLKEQFNALKQFPWIIGASFQLIKMFFEETIGVHFNIA